MICLRSIAYYAHTASLDEDAFRRAVTPEVVLELIEMANRIPELEKRNRQLTYDVEEAEERADGAELEAEEAIDNLRRVDVKMTRLCDSAEAVIERAECLAGVAELQTALAMARAAMIR